MLDRYGRARDQASFAEASWPASFRETLPFPEGFGGLIWLHQGNHYHHPRHRHEAIELNLVVTGHGHYEVAGVDFALGPGSLLFIYPEQDHELADRSPDFEMWIVALHPALLEETCTTPDLEPLCARLPRGEQCKLLPWDDASWLDREFERLIARRSRKTVDVGLAYCALEAWEAFEAAPTGPRPMSANMHRAMALVANDPTLSRSDVAERIDVSPSTLAQMFHDELGLSFTNYRTKLRVERFAELIASRSCSLLKASADAGFGSYAQCHRAFVAAMGCSPREHATRLQRS